MSCAISDLVIGVAYCGESMGAMVQPITIAKMKIKIAVILNDDNVRHVNITNIYPRLKCRHYMVVLLSCNVICRVYSNSELMQ